MEDINFIPSIKGRNQAFSSFLDRLPFDEQEPVFISLSLLPRTFRAVIIQGRERVRFYSERINAGGGKDDVERLATLKVIVDAMASKGFDDIETDSPLVSFKTG